MLPLGNRAAAGGMPGDSYTPYSGMEAITTDDIEALFDNAEVSIYLSLVKCFY